MTSATTDFDNCQVHGLRRADSTDQARVLCANQLATLQALRAPAIRLMCAASEPAEGTFATGLVASAPFPTATTHAVGLVSSAPLSTDRTGAINLMIPTEFVPNSHAESTFTAAILSVLGSFWNDPELAAMLPAIFDRAEVYRGTSLHWAEIAQGRIEPYLVYCGSPERDAPRSFFRARFRAKACFTRRFSPGFK